MSECGRMNGGTEIEGEREGGEESRKKYLHVQ